MKALMFVVALLIGGGVAQPAQAATSYSDLDCGDSAARLFQLRANGMELWYASISGPAATKPIVYQWTKVYDFNAARPGLAVAAHTAVAGSVKLFVTDREGGLRSYNFSIEKTAITSAANLHSGPGPYGFSRLTSDGRRLYGTKDGKLVMMTGITASAAPKASVTLKTIGWPLAFWGNAGSDKELFFTDTDGALRVVDVSASSAEVTTIRSEGWEQSAITSPGGGLVIRDTPTNTWRHLIDLPDVSTHQTISTTLKTPDLPITTAPAECDRRTAPGGDAAVTYEQLTAMFGARVAGRDAVEAGLPGLIREMAAGNITTPARKAAFLATLVNESTVYYGSVQNGSSTYRGRGFIQLTGDFNYRAAGNALGTDLLGNPSRAATLAWSDKIARWYWTKARPATNRYADAHDMGMVNLQIGFGDADQPGSAEVAERCRDFKNAYKVLTGSLPTGVECSA